MYGTTAPSPSYSRSDPSVEKSANVRGNRGEGAQRWVRWCGKVRGKYAEAGAGVRFSEGTVRWIVYYMVVGGYLSLSEPI